MSKRSILVIEDESDIRRLLQFNLEKEGYGVLLAKTGEEGFDLAKNAKPDLILLDLMLPGMDGLEVCRLLRSERSTQAVPVIMLTAKGTETDQVVGLEVGAADYISKPFSVKVLLARIKAALRKHRRAEESPSILKVREFALDRQRQSFTAAGRPIAFTKLEFDIMRFLMQNPGRVFSRDELLSGAWKGEAFVVDRTVDVHMRSIRQKLGRHRELIETVRGVGYRLNDGVS